MRVLFDHQVFDSQTVEGPSRYFVELARHLIDVGVDVEFAVRETDNVFLHGDPRWSGQIVSHRQSLVWLARLRQMAVRAGILPYMAVYQANQNESEAALSTGNFDIFHPTYYEPYFLPLLNKKPFVLTVHDMIHELFPQYVKSGNPTTQWKRRVVEASTHIIAVSECTKQDLIRIFHVPPERITVVHHGVGGPFTESSEGGSRVGYPYLLYLGSRDRYKNFTCLVHALPEIIRRTPDLHVICVGGGGFTATEKKSIRKLGFEKHCEQMSASDQQLAALYRGAQAFVFPSLYEGFGMPILEAFASGCPVIVSRASAFPEVGADAALYFDPQQPPDLARAVNKLLASPDLQNGLRHAGRQRAASFTWSKTAAQTLAVYETAMYYTG